jgi:hypothetical protein
MGYKDGKLPFESHWRLLAWSTANELDFAIVEVPAGYFSQLGIKVGKVNSRFGQRTGVVLYGYKDGQRSMSLGTAAPMSVWRLKYGASTMPSWSGTPILDSRQRILGVHTEASTTGKYNVGTALPIHLFTKESYTEAPAYEDVTDGRGSENGDDGYDGDFDMTVYTENSKHKYKIIENDKYRHAREELDARATIIGWGAYMEEMDNLEMQFKESITLCPHCGLAQEHDRVCAGCGFRTDKMTEDQLVEKVRFLLNPVREIFSTVIADTKIIDLSIDAVVERYRKKGLLVKALNEMTVTGHLPTQNLKTSRLPSGVNVEPLDVTPDIVVQLADVAKTSKSESLGCTMPKVTKVIVPNKNEAIVTQVETLYVLDEPRSALEGGVALNQVKEASKVNLKVRRRRRDPKKESLNSKVPSQEVIGTKMPTLLSGLELNTPGQEIKKSTKSSLPLVTQPALTTKAAKPKVQKSGKGLSSSTLSGQVSLNGLSAAQLQSLVVSATNLLVGNKQ